MDSQFKQLLSTIKDYERRLSALERSNQVKTIKDADGNTIIDSSGLNSVSNFQRAQLFNGSSGLASSSTSFVDVPGSSMSSLVLSRDTNVLVYMMSHGLNTDAINSDLTDAMEVQIYDSSVAGQRANTVSFGITATRLWVDGGGFLNWSSGVANQMVFQMAVLQFEAATHNLKLQYRAISGGSAHLNAWLIGYIVLGR